MPQERDNILRGMTAFHIPPLFLAPESGSRSSLLLVPSLTAGCGQCGNDFLVNVLRPSAVHSSVNLAGIDPQSSYYQATRVFIISTAFLFYSIYG